jgi:hypothetical protein
MAVFAKQLCISLVVALLLSACSTPTLVEIARRRQATDQDRRAGYDVKDDVRVKYSVTDWDVLNFTDEVKRKLANRSSFHMGFSYGTSGTNATLGALAGAAQALGWGVATASGFGLGATYVFGMGQIFQSKGQAQAYEQSFTQIQAAEATYYFHQLGMSFNKTTGKVDPGDINGRRDIPSQTNLTPDGETLYYRASRILKVLNDTLASKIPDLQDLKEAHGESGASGAPAIPADASTVGTPTGGGSKNRPPSASQFGNTGPPQRNTTETTASSQSDATDAIADSPGKLLQQFGWPGGTQNEQNVAQLKKWMEDNGLKEIDVATLIYAKQYSAQRREAVKSLRLSHAYSRDPAGVALQQYCWPGGVKNDQNISAIRKWMTDNGLGSVDLVTFIYGADYASQRQTALRYLHIADTSSRDTAAIVLQQYCWPGGAKNDQNMATLRKWMDDNGLADIDPVIFIHSVRFAAQRQTAINSLRLSNSYVHDAWGTKLQNFCWPSGKENNNNMDKLRQWMNSIGLVDVDFASFIYGLQYAVQRRDAVGFLQL